MATANPDQPSPEEAAIKINSLLNDRKETSTRPKVVEDSHEKAKLQRQQSADADCLSRSNKEHKLEHFLKGEKPRRHRRRRKLTIQDVRAEAAKILEEFLEAQLNQNEIQTSSPEKRYERYVEANITEGTSPSPTSSGYLASNSGVLREDSIPFADDTDEELTKAESLPHDDFMKKYFTKSDDGGVEIIHSKSKSAPYDGGDTEVYGVAPKPRGNRGNRGPPPPAPPGTPHTPSEQGSLEHVNSSVPYQGKIRHSLKSADSNKTDSLERKSEDGKRPTPPKVPTTLDIPAPLNKSRSTTPSDVPISSSSRSSASPGKSATLPASLPAKRRKDPGYASTDTDGEGSDIQEYHAAGRRKKSLFKKAQERLHIFLKTKDKPERRDSEKFDTRQKVLTKKKTKSKKSKKKKNDKNVDEADVITPRSDGDSRVLEERHIHTRKHVHQTHIGEGGRSVYRTEDGTEVVELERGSRKKHVKKEWNVKESTSNESGFMGKLRRLTSKTDKKRMKSSKSMNIGHECEGPPEESVPYPPDDCDKTTDVYADDSDGFNVTETERSRYNDTDNVHVTQVVSRGEDEFKRHSSHLDIVDHDGTMVERIFFNDDEDARLPRNKSFDYEHESCVHERRVMRDGKVRVIRDVDTHDHISVSEDDMETDGHSGDDQKPLQELTAEEKEELYGKIAERLAMIGDNLTVEREMEQASLSGPGLSPAGSPRSKLDTATGGKATSPEPEIERTELSQLETEIRDELRMVADEIDARIEGKGPPLAANAQQAALRIAGIVTYNHFKNVVSESVGNEVGWAQVAAVFNITKRAIQVAGASGAFAMQIKEMSLRYIEDKFANWIVAKGGWDSMLSEDDDSDVNYSDVD